MFDEEKDGVRCVELGCGSWITMCGLSRNNPRGLNRQLLPAPLPGVHPIESILCIRHARYQY